MYVYLLKETTEFNHPATYFAVFLISHQIFTNVMETADRTHVTKSMA